MIWPARYPGRYLAHFLGLSLILAGCSGGSGGNQTEPGLYQQLFNAGKQSLTERTTKEAQLPPLTRAALNTLNGSYLEVTLERGGQLAYLYVNAERRDDSPGRIIIWRSEDNVTLAMRNGVLIATRGLGGDVLSSGVQVSGDSPGPARSGERVQYIRVLDNKERRLSLACDLVDLGAETITIVERNHPTRHLQERCTGGGGTVVNDYWVDSRAGLVWQSRQWAGPVIGYLRTRRLTN